MLKNFANLGRTLVSGKYVAVSVLPETGNFSSGTKTVKLFVCHKSFASCLFFSSKSKTFVLKEQVFSRTLHMEIPCQ
eukprot:g61770.t1